LFFHFVDESYNNSAFSITAPHCPKSKKLKEKPEKLEYFS